MEIRRLKLGGFKSFVDATELRIEAGLTGIVGPNGCGKSNLLEAIRWVMGESSPKSMRGGGMEDVIFAGTATRPQRDFAEVVIGCENAPAEAMRALGLAGDGGVDGGTLEVVRRIERGAGSAYRANGRDVRAKDVALIFADAATGAHSPALVSQGRIAAVIAARPQERRAMLEEAAGIAGLHVRRRDAEQKLRAAEANLARLDDILADMDSRAAVLRRQARAAERYTRLTQQIRAAEARTIFARWREAAAAAEAARGEAARAGEAVRLGQEAQGAAAAWTNDAVAKLAAARATAQTARDAANAAGHRLETLKAEHATLLQRLADLGAQAERLLEDQRREDDLAHDAADAIGRLTGEGAGLAARIKAAEAARPDFAGRLAAAESAARDTEVALAHAMARQASEQAERRVAEAALVSAATRLERVVREVARIAAAGDALGDAAPLAARGVEAKAAAQQAEADRSAAQTGLAEAEAARTAAAEARGAAESALAAARATLAALDSESAALRRAVETGSGSQRALDQIKADPGYERALAAALGDDLEAGIGGTGKRRWAGVAPQAGDPPLPEGSQSLAAHVAAPEELARRLAQVAVAERDAGQALAVGQRLVTLDGQLRRWDGYVASEGGAAAAERLIRLNRLEAIAAARPAAEGEVAAAATALEQAGTEASHAAATATRHRAALEDADGRLRAALRAGDEAASALSRLKGEQQQIAARRQEAEDDHRQAARERDSAAAMVADMPDGADTGAEVATHTLASETARSAVAHIQAEQAVIDRAIEADQARAAAAEAEARSWRARSGEAAKRIAEMGARGEAIAGEQAGIGERPDNLAAEIAHLSEGGTVLAAEAEAAGAAERAAQAALREAENRLAAAGEALAAAREARAGAAARAEAADERRIEISRLSGERFDCPPPVLVERIGFDADTIRTAQIEHDEAERLTLERERIGPVNLVAASELAELEEQQATSRAESDELTQAIHRLRGSIGSLNREGRTRLLAAFEAVDSHFRRLFTTLFDGGQAHLELVESDDPLEAGLEIMAQPPGKKLSALTLLSGGEQALTAIALIFALFLTNPAPICVLDEVDAPLDDANVERFCDLLDHMVADTSTRYLIVTHNAVTMSRMHRLFGVTMIERGVSRLVSVDLSGAESLLAAE